MKKKITILGILGILVSIAAFIIYENYYYAYLLLTNAPNYPTGRPVDNMEIYQIAPETILTSLNSGNTDVFMPTLKNPIYDDVSPLEPYSSFPWNQQDSLMVANSFHQFVWKETLENWHLYSAGFTIPQCKDISRINVVGFKFYQRQKNLYYLIHNVDINLEYGYIYASDNNGYYTGQWKDVDLNKVKVDNVDKALLIAEQNGGQEARAGIKDDQKCHISIFYSPHPLFDRAWSDWSWEVTYWTDSGDTFMYGIIIDPYTGKYQILNANK